MATITGIQTINSTALLEVDGDPRLLGGLDRNIGDFAIDTETGNLYVKRTISPTGWEHINQRNNFLYVQTANQISTSTTHATVTDLTSETLPVGTYEFNVFGIFQSTATGTGIGFRLNQTSAVIGDIQAVWRVETGGNGTDKFFEYTQQNLATNVVTANTLTANTNFLFLGSGMFTISTEGAIALEFRSETTTAVSVRVNSKLSIRRVA